MTFVKLGISVEGRTEEQFVQKILSPYLRSFHIEITPVNMFGRINLDRIIAELHKLARHYQYCTTLYDFYGFQGKAETDSKHSLEHKISLGLHPDVSARTIPYIQLHEFEALLFSAPSALADHIHMKQRQAKRSVLEWAEAILSHYDHNPERINDSPITAPSKRLKKHTNYRKTTHAALIANSTGIQVIRQQCHGFDRWLTQLEGLQPRYIS